MLDKISLNDYKDDLKFTGLWIVLGCPDQHLQTAVTGQNCIYTEYCTLSYSELCCLGMASLDEETWDDIKFWADESGEECNLDEDGLPTTDEFIKYILSCESDDSEIQEEIDYKLNDIRERLLNEANYCHQYLAKKLKS